MLPENSISRRYERGEGIPAEPTVYDHGYMAAEDAVKRTGSLTIHPSLVNHADFISDWDQFMDGWHAGIDHMEKRLKHTEQKASAAA